MRTVLSLAALGASCASAQCEFNSDCGEHARRVMNMCARDCVEDRDCLAGQACGVNAEGKEPDDTSGAPDISAPTDLAAMPDNPVAQDMGVVTVVDSGGDVSVDAGMDGSLRPKGRAMGVALDTAIGLTFIFLLFSTIVSAIQEFIAWIVELRARTMRQELARLLADPSAGTLLQEFLAHPHVRQQTGRALLSAETNAPSYLPKGTFSATLIDMLTGSSAREALPALREAFRDPPAGPGTVAAALAAVLALDAPQGEAGAVAAFEAAITAAPPEALTSIEGRVAKVPQSILKALALAAVAPGAKADARVAAVVRLARLVARRSPTVALHHAIEALPATPVRNALLTALEAGSVEAREAAVASVGEVVRGAGGPAAPRRGPRLRP